MFRKFLNKAKRNEGSISLGVVLTAPVILLILFLMIDYLHIAADKASLQRRVDSAVLTIVTEAAPGEEVLVDINGYIAEGPYAGQKVCAITDAMVDRGIEQLRRDAYDVGIDLDGVVNVADAEQMLSGVARIQAKGYSNNLMINALIPGGVSVPYFVEGYASCSIKATE